jgi:hypothetical protein
MHFMEQSGKKNPGTPLSVTALVISILGLLVSPFVFFITTGWASFDDGKGSALALAIGWMFFCSASVLLGIFGRRRSRLYGYKSTLAVTAIIIGLIAELLCVCIVYSIFQVDSF